MNKSLIAFLIIVLFPLIILSIFYFSKHSSDNNSQPSDNETQRFDILVNDKGQPQMATGNCNQNSDCFPTGCSSQVCANHEVFTTCEVVDFPEKETYSCGCIENRCVWYRQGSKI
ncbi:hypothetical protein A2715_01390 [Candidatus Woesebacteria bacterium RIFCSPHIGHO2_01_FULL_39_32]|uniref:Transmembrane protein n=1 Tax=Candidatus Woesebacteria bacterium RIFCSPLOWO2_01_FULL_39_25 TaxID=1802521 RepID=A0A1F8BJH2_9BACT|nr:MAG: hypothetical protein A2124_03825 [Candidatus Woesebacteria bacterium GWB1_37_5]OGM24135.1 MAG: hypothetical protein A2715_01390 [Candidatus Woesebacteria bacterium RIFCSPHIGHO2_01_FULL_39_32]OGM38111.1 MAG: hypothetical protein A3F01_02160 [Candidatus Woesebacteria bacterium RIFCSPHIGHO2_12_FULL_38_11]OGM64217.1 MAG: hypothetical protein A2893_06655 [Candidatus Woesebacteria bacterium RIFCSPLOWO2_01_FULL_39_25]